MKTFFQYAIGGIASLILVLIGLTPIFIFKPQTVLGWFFTVLLCLFIYAVLLILIGLAVSKNVNVWDDTEKNP